MKFRYFYKTSDNVRHDGIVEAPTKDVAFSRLIENGIRPIKVIPFEPSIDVSATNMAFQNPPLARAKLSHASVALIAGSLVLLSVAVFLLAYRQRTFDSVTTAESVADGFSVEFRNLVRDAEALEQTALDAAAVAQDDLTARIHIEEARESIKRLFRTVYPKLNDKDGRERLEAQVVYGRIMMMLDGGLRFCEDTQKGTNGIESNTVVAPEGDTSSGITE